MELEMKNLVWLLFLPGFLCNENPLKINPDSLVTWKGSCVLIPCQISTYKGAVLVDISLLWYFQPFYDANLSDYSGCLLYNSSSTSRSYGTRSQSASARRFEFVGNLEKKNCSLKISQVRTEDSGIYGARLSASYSIPVQHNKWFLTATVNVPESPPTPKIDINPKDVQEGWTTVTCSVPYHCPEEPLRLTISGLEESRLSTQRTTVIGYGSRLPSKSRTAINNGMIQTVVGFQVTGKDHGKSLVCSLKRQNGTEISQRTMKLDVKCEFCPFYDISQTEYSGDLLYNSSSTPRNYQTRSQTASASRFEFVGNLEEKTCSLMISRVRTEDSGIYGARLFASHSRPVQRNKWFLNATVNVAESPPVPKIDTSPKILQEVWTTVTCSVPYHCPEEPLRLIISGLENSRFSSKPPTITNGVIQTVMRFQVTWKDHGKSLICSLKRDRKEISQNTMQLDVKYAPKDVHVRASPGTIIREGETLSLECMINSSNPEVSEYLWYQDDQPMYEQPKLKKIEFVTKGERHSGAYRCVAKNSVGSQKSEELSIDVQCELIHCDGAVDGTLNVGIINIIAGVSLQACDAIVFHSRSFR
ncbi:B-cell receptor CD22-like [Heteronotia binoei]|uniref:B-cell receptor CD22-like n=1 Tax=Heteronotia binoei TaxID=13085 RepID=UPI00292CF99B|nr:B-cell receptor CD22-like [Heteronotia binoei]